MTTISIQLMYRKGVRSNGITCNDNGVCSCKANIINDKCDACNTGFFNFPTCEGMLYDTFTNYRNSSF